MFAIFVMVVFSTNAFFNPAHISHPTQITLQLPPETVTRQHNTERTVGPGRRPRTMASIIHHVHSHRDTFFRDFSIFNYPLCYLIRKGTLECFLITFS